MRIPCLLFGLLISFSPCVCQTTTPSPVTSEFAIVSGSVVRLDTGQRLKKALVALESRSDAPNSIYDTTDEQGHFSVQKVAPGSYRLVVSRNGFVDAEYGQRSVARVLS